eukprot:jgi/Tetstr1/445013/TSEL_032821.t1
MAGDKGAAARVFSVEDVARHNTPADCWVIVRGRVYDVTAWAPKHPGGDLLFVKAGGDCTQLFDSYHPLSARRVLEKYYIGDAAPPPGGWTTYADDLDDGQFYEVLKSRVYKFMKENKLDPRWAPAMYVKSFLILATVAVSFYAAFFYFTNPLTCLVCAVVNGIAMAEVGVSIQHDANHGAYASSPAICHLMGLTLDVFGGASSFMWKQQHVVGHHAFTNLHDNDPDIRVSEKDVRRVTSFQPWHGYQKYQHIYLALLYGLLALKSVLLDDFTALLEGKIGPVKIAKFTARENAEFWSGKALFAAYFVGLPLLASPHSLAKLALLWLTAEACTGWTLAFMFQVAHVVPDVKYIKKEADGTVKLGWAEAQVATSADFSHGSSFWTHLSGGLNYQVVHHLFPGICHVHYPKIAPVVMQTCKEFGIPYTVYPTFGNALSAHFKHLKNVGSGVVVPSLATVG